MQGVTIDRGAASFVMFCTRRGAPQREPADRLPPAGLAPRLIAMNPEVATRRRRLALRLAGAGLVWSLGLLLTALVVPLYNGQTTSDATGLTLSTATYVERFGVWTVIPLVLPVLAAIAALVAITGPSHRRRRAAAALIGLTAVAGIVFVVSGGVVLLPVALLTAGGLRLVRSPRDAGRTRPRARREPAPRSGAAEGKGA